MKDATRDENGVPSAFVVRAQGGPRGHWFSAAVVVVDGVFVCDQLVVTPAIDGEALDSAAGLRVPLQELLKTGAAIVQGIEYDSEATGGRELLPVTTAEQRHASRGHTALGDQARLQAFADAWRRARAAHPASQKAVVSRVSRELNESRSNVYRLRDAARSAGLLGEGDVEIRANPASPALRARIEENEERLRADLAERVEFERGKREFGAEQRRKMARRQAEGERIARAREAEAKQQRRGKQQ